MTPFAGAPTLTSRPVARDARQEDRGQHEQQENAEDYHANWFHTYASVKFYQAGQVVLPGNIIAVVSNQTTPERFFRKGLGHPQRRGPIVA